MIADLRKKSFPTVRHKEVLKVGPYKEALTVEI